MATRVLLIGGLWGCAISLGLHAAYWTGFQAGAEVIYTVLLGGLAVAITSFFRQRTPGPVIDPETFGPKSLDFWLSAGALLSLAYLLFLWKHTGSLGIPLRNPATPENYPRATFYSTLFFYLTIIYARRIL